MSQVKSTGFPAACTHTCHTQLVTVHSHIHIHIHVHIRCGCFSMIIKCGRRRSATDHLYAAPVMSPGRDWRRRRRYALWRPPPAPSMPPPPSPRAALINYATLPPPPQSSRTCVLSVYIACWAIAAGLSGNWEQVTECKPIGCLSLS